MKAIKAFLYTMNISVFEFLDSSQRKEVYSGFRKYDLSLEQVLAYARKDISSHRMNFCKHVLAEGFPAKEMREWLDKDLNTHVFRYVIDCRINNVPKERVRTCLIEEKNLEKCFYNYNELLRQYGKKK
ncbi:MAG: hypothetical protein E7314_01995 [Clostridiales bacterium]|nr:hypothetical protein [Clostridiales bacterium]